MVLKLVSVFRTPENPKLWFPALCILVYLNNKTANIRCVALLRKHYIALYALYGFCAKLNLPKTESCFEMKENCAKYI